MLLYIVRHAWAEERDDTHWPDDLLRPLTPDGVDRFERMVKKLHKVGFAPELVATSPAVRCQQTAEIISKRTGNPEVIPAGPLAPGSDLAAMHSWMADHPKNTVAWVGHAPDVGRLTARLIGNGELNIRFAKGAIAAIRFESTVQAGAGELQWLATAKLLSK
ncbi:MAG TPA: histidine phosphatase family protein [Pirellulales bacterium]|jgi:phosphohistidine phosphatase